MVDERADDDEPTLIKPEQPAKEQVGHTNGRKLSDTQIEEMRKLYRKGELTINQLHIKFGVNNRTVRKYLGLKH